jgi:hypothetical protein
MQGAINAAAWSRTWWAEGCMGDWPGASGQASFGSITVVRLRAIVLPAQ